MDTLFYDIEELHKLLDRLASEYDSLEDSYEKLKTEVLKWGDKLGEYKIVAEESARHLEESMDAVRTLQEKLVKSLEVYEKVEKENKELVDKLAKIDFGSSKGRKNESGIISGFFRYQVIHDDSGYAGNSNYDFDDWLMQWLIRGL